MGLTIVVEALDGATVKTVELNLPRVIDDEWIGQLIWWGIALSVLGFIALIALFIDVRPAQSKSEEWLARRSAIGSGKGEPKPGSRRHRRQMGATMPVAEIPAEPTPAGSIPVVEAPATTSGVFVVPVTGSPAEQLAPSASPQTPVSQPSPAGPASQPSPASPVSAATPPSAAAPGVEPFIPPATNDEEDRS